jgi:8-oxo-dGTP diphosphatase
MRVVAAVIQDQGRFLACRRAPHKSLPGQWEFPGGKVEPGETDQEALARELVEELSISVRVGDFIIETSNAAGIEMATYFVQLSGDRPEASSDHDRLIWVQASDLSRLDWAELDVPVVRELERLSGTSL